MAKSRTYPSQRNCEWCAQPVRQNGDYLRARLHDSCVLFHWSCFIALMRKSEDTQGQRKAS
jgi:hypothetical protein